MLNLDQPNNEFKYHSILKLSIYLSIYQSINLSAVAKSPTNGLNHSPKYRKMQQYEVSLDPEANPRPCAVMGTSLPSYVLVTILSSCKYIPIL